MTITTKEKLLTDIICQHYNVRFNSLKEDNKKRVVANPRHVYCFLMRKVFNKSYSQIGRDINRDHTTVINSTRLIKTLIEVKDPIAYSVFTIEDSFNNECMRTEEYTMEELYEKIGHKFKIIPKTAA